MEDFSTVRRPFIPVAANLATVAVVVLTMAWSGTHRPAVGDTLSSASQANAVPSKPVEAAGPAVELAAVNARIGDVSNGWAPTARHAGNVSGSLPALKPVGYQPARSAN